MRSKRTDRLTVEPKPLWQRVLAGERLPKRQSRHPKCEGTIEDHRTIALDVRELIRKRVFEQPAGSIPTPRTAEPSEHRSNAVSVPAAAGAVQEYLGEGLTS